MLQLVFKLLIKGYGGLVEVCPPCAFAWLGEVCPVNISMCKDMAMKYLGPDGCHFKLLGALRVCW